MPSVPSVPVFTASMPVSLGINMLLNAVVRSELLKAHKRILLMTCVGFFCGTVCSVKSHLDACMPSHIQALASLVGKASGVKEGRAEACSDCAGNGAGQSSAGQG